MTAFDSTYDFRFLKAHVSIGMVLHAYGLDANLRTRGAQLLGPCPLHHGDNPTAFRVHLSRGVWNCLTCCGGGDVVDLVCRIHDCRHAEAARHMRRLLLGTSPENLPGEGGGHPPASPPETFRPFASHIPLDPHLPFLQAVKGISVATARSFEAGWTDRSTFLRGTAAIRLHDLDGNPLGYCGRRLDPDQAAQWGKWRFPRHYPKADTLFNAHRALPVRPRGLVVVECPWATLRLVQAGVSGVVSLMGTRVSDGQARWLAKASAVLLLLDGDQAGRNAARTIGASLAEATTVRVHELPEGKEPEDLSDDDLRAIVGQTSFSLNPYTFGTSLPFA